MSLQQENSLLIRLRSLSNSTTSNVSGPVSGTRNVSTGNASNENGLTTPSELKRSLSGISQMCLKGPNSNINESSNMLDTSVLEEMNKKKWRNRHLHNHFAREIPSDQICVADFTCALEVKGVLRQGRMYFTGQWVCFHSPIGGVKVLIHVSDIEKVVPKKNLVFPTSIHVLTCSGTLYNFTSFLFRNNALNSFSVLISAWSNKMAQARACSSSEETIILNEEEFENSISQQELSEDDDDSDNHMNGKDYQLYRDQYDNDIPTLSSLTVTQEHPLSLNTTNHSNTPVKPKHHRKKLQKKINSSSKHVHLDHDPMSMYHITHQLVYMSASVCIGFMALNLLVYVKSIGLVL